MQLRQGKAKDSFYTPAEVSRIIAKIVGVENATSSDQTAYDPTCGSGSLLLKVGDEAPVDISLYGQEIDFAVANLARMNMIMHGKPDAVIEQGNTLSKPKFKEEGRLKTFDFAVANPPFSQKNWMNGVNVENDPYHRFDDGIPPASNGDYAFLLHLIKSLKPGKGKGAIILPHGVLFRGGAEAQIRRNLIKKGYIKGIIGLPPNLFYGTGIPAVIVVIDKENAAVRKGIFMIDASKGFRKDGAKNRLRERDIHKIVTTFVNFKEIPGYSKVVSLDEIEKNDYNLNIPRYLNNAEQEDVQDIHAHLHGGIPKRDIDNIGGLKVFRKLKESLFGKKEQDYYPLKIDIEGLQEFVERCEEVESFKDKTLDIFKSWADDRIVFLKSINSGTETRQFIKEVSESLLESFEDVELVDEYAIYQILMDYWDEEMKDDVYMIIENGWDAKPCRILEKNKKGREVDRGWTCDILPKEMVIDEFFEKEKVEIEGLEARQEEIERQMEELREEHSGEEGVLEDVKNEKGNITKKDLQLKIKELKLNPEEFKEDLELLQEYLGLMDEQAKIKKQIKERKKELDEKLLRKYGELSEEDVKRLVVERKWIARIEEGVKDELDTIILNLTTRIKELSERYREPLPEIAREVENYEKGVREHLKIMGFEI